MKRPLTLMVLVALGCIFSVPAGAQASSPSGPPDRLGTIVETFAKSAVDEGIAVGVGVGITLGDAPPRFFSYGLARVGTRPEDGEPFSPDTLFQIGSVTKVFTTNLLGQNVFLGFNDLQQPLSDFTAQLGPISDPLTASVTLEMLGDFTGGFPSAPQCLPPEQVRGCTTGRPTITEYDAQDLAEYFANAVPRDFTTPPPPLPVSTLPAPYNYSDISTALIGLLLGGDPDQPLGNEALQGWADRVREQITEPLRMKGTFLLPPSAQSHAGVAGGYAQALASATVANGQVTGITVTAAGQNYQAGTPPLATIVGGGGQGAQAEAIVACGDNDDPLTCSVQEINVLAHGDGYVAPPTVIFDPPGAQGRVIVERGRVVAVRVSAGGCYASAPTVMITGGRRAAQGRDARAEALISNGTVNFVRIMDGGAGYVDPIAVIVAPGLPLTNNIPIWAPAGALSSTVRDMITFAKAALGHEFIKGVRINPAILAAFTIAQMAYAPEPSTCPPTLPQSGLAWSILPADPANGIGALISKNGGLPGFSTEVMLMPALNLGVVVFVNSRQIFEQSGKPSHDAGNIAQNILFAIVHELP